MELLKSILERMRETVSYDKDSKIAIYVELDDIDDFLEISQDLGHRWINGFSLYPRKADDPVDTFISMCKECPNGICFCYSKISNGELGITISSKENCQESDFEIINLKNLIDFKPAKFAKKLQDIVDIVGISTEERNTLLDASVINLLYELRYNKAADILQSTKF